MMDEVFMANVLAQENHDADVRVTRDSLVSAQRNNYEVTRSN
jgi:hypothetical protein